LPLVHDDRVSGRFFNKAFDLPIPEGESVETCFARFAASATAGKAYGTELNSREQGGGTVRMPGTPDGHEHGDSCVCDIALRDDEITSDSDLPAASGGVAAAQRHHGTDEADGCDLEFNDAEPTADEDLPVAAGGVG
jgi:hypothetical protein